MEHRILTTHAAPAIFDQADALAAAEYLDQRAVTPACAAIRSARLSPAGVRQILQTLACAMSANPGFSDTDIASIDGASESF